MKERGRKKKEPITVRKAETTGANAAAATAVHVGYGSRITAMVSFSATAAPIYRQYTEVNNACYFIFTAAIVRI